MFENASRGGVVLTASLVLAGCGGAAIHEQPAAFYSAYHEGCQIGYAMATSDSTFWFMGGKDKARYAGEDAYRRGWDFGYQECFADMQSIGTD